jgi:hypothetical protein
MSAHVGGHECRSSGFDTVVVEARDRIGGRTHTVDLGGGAADLGAAFIHDPANNPLTAFLDSHRIDWRSNGMWGNGLRVFADGDWLPPELTSTLVAAMYTFDDAAASEAPLGQSDRLSDGIAWYAASQEFGGRRTAVVKQFLGRIVGSGIDGDDPSESSLAGGAVYAGDDSGGNGIVVGGYRALVEELGEGLSVRLSTPIEVVDHDTDHVTLKSRQGSIDANWVIITVPLGVLKSGGLQLIRCCRTATLGHCPG